MLADEIDEGLTVKGWICSFGIFAADLDSHIVILLLRERQIARVSLPIEHCSVALVHLSAEEAVSGE